MRASWIVLVLICACSREQRSEPAAPSVAGVAAPLPDAGAMSLPVAPTPSDAGQASVRVRVPMTAPLRDAGHVQDQTADAGRPPEPLASRVVLEGQVENARDLGGIALTAGGRVVPRRLFRGPPLANLTPRGCSEVAELGLRSVIDLRIDSEVSLKPDEACALDEIEAQLVAAPLPVPYNVSAADYIAVLDARESIAKIFEVLGDKTRYPVYFHCTWGRDRTGILAALILLALGAPEDAIMEDYLESRRTVGAYPASLEAALAEIERRGGIAAYLTASGVTAQQLEVLRAQAR